MKRSQFLKAVSVGSALAFTGKIQAGNLLPLSDFPEGRPAPDKRKFVSQAVEAEIERMKSLIHDRDLRILFENCFPNTLDTTVFFNGSDASPDTFVITGDIHAMWLRDSSAQVTPYIPLAAKDRTLQSLLAGVIQRQAKCILLDPYANAFLREGEKSEWAEDETTMKPGVHERKWEVDSLCYAIRLSYLYYYGTNDSTPFNQLWQDAMRLVYDTFVEQQRKQNRGPYRFGRKTSWQTDTLPGNGYGNPAKPVGLIYSMFRPSDDATIFPFLVPSNCFAVVSLRQLSELWLKLQLPNDFAAACKTLADEIDAALQQYAVGSYNKKSPVFAYEVDGYGNALYMDDANIPSLLALPYLGYCKNDSPVYQNTREYILSSRNPYFYKGSAGEGIGGPHAGVNQIWPLAITMRGLSTDNETELSTCIAMLKRSALGTGFMHESFHKDNCAKYTRSWFAWANTLFGEFLIEVSKKHPEILKKSY